MMLVPAKDVEISIPGFITRKRVCSQDLLCRISLSQRPHLGAADDVPLPLDLSIGFRSSSRCSSLGPLTLGIARGAIDCFIELMATKVDRFTGTALREPICRSAWQAEAAMRTARAFL